MIGCGGVGLSALLAAVAAGADPVVAVDAAAGKLDVARDLRRVGGGGLAGRRGGDRRGGAQRLGRWRGLRDRGDGTTRGDGGGVPLDARSRGGRSHRHPARRRDAVPPGSDDPAHGGRRVSARSTARRSPSGTSRTRSRCTGPEGYRSIGSSRTGFPSTRQSAFRAHAVRRRAACGARAPSVEGSWTSWTAGSARLGRRGAERLARQRRPRAAAARPPRPRSRCLPRRPRSHTLSASGRRRPSTSPSGRRR